MKYFVYILMSFSGVLYIGVTNNLIRRVYEHKENLIEGFTKKYRIKSLVYYEEFSDIKDALTREKQLKHWNREWKLNLIKEFNPTLTDLYKTITN
ncbi:MAG: Endonuclease [Candidatus Gottesmanbacteria bacterium GW2011_GWB1_43_11]|uniref:Endonuclease n=1 Tax=Candidatus Gottesmanbacteria bacterium GW2011_GWB1_43_11 TaxID=1618446 RepID=A0A0G1CM66_9BACT|nr:MAG: Endonuclease [Candidatus Gottesmanbacteria bacterium GW2011_GWA2_42_16]KKS80757.1 MAG: Endonuclease [Candidatus Gottesmanbacteria bacterium GW2011_GWC1_43_10]KKS86587.1 MAG: Endonuclease [Candidatus Gottesmanbacteria bacterium GW2011_GWB1_43_11]OGG09179.1 MAG: hypothetical protein A2699_02300 [Candidatus Gottesmanbacteria bacterium RIFCSPHIGHO2_01_FULL_43_15]OGG25391.1 MAG: hypothetical protein A3A59_00920 [Candidatus Gottesmanbacteria bacterium RIFCSPLOWO2_01_FULL_42_10]